MNTTPATLPLSMPWGMAHDQRRANGDDQKDWMIDQLAQITFEVAEIDGIEANERGEQTPVSLKGLRVRLPEHIQRPGACNQPTIFILASIGAITNGTYRATVHTKLTEKSKK